MNKEKIKEYWNRSAHIAERYNIPTVLIFVDRIWCKIRYRITLSYEYDYYGMYRLNHRERKNFYTDGRFHKTVDWFFTPEMIAAVDSKKGFTKNFNEFLCREVLPLPCSRDDLIKFASMHDVMFVKEEYSCGGKGVSKFTKEEILNDNILFNYISNMDGVIEERIVQHPTMGSLNDDSVSTVRITSLIEKSGDIRILGAILRVGKPESFVDNASSGGYIFIIDIEEGVVTGYGKDFNGNKTLKSPTGIIMPGFKIPFWKEILELINEAAAKYPEARLVGWDVAIGPQGPLLVEANVSTSSVTIQFEDYGCWNYLLSQR